MSLFTNIITGGTNSHQSTSEEANYYATDFFSTGIVGSSTNTSLVAPMTGAFSCNAQGTPDNTIAIGTGVAYVRATPTGQGSQILRVNNTAQINTTINANTSGSTRYDFIYIKIDPDKAVNPAVDASDVASIVVSRSTSNTADNGTPPTYGLLIAIVTVANGFSTITNGNIFDMRVRAVPNNLNTGWFPTSGWTYASYDSTNKTGIVNVSSSDPSDVGSKVRIINNNTIQYGIIQAKTSTTRTIYFGTDYSLTNAAILNPHYTPPKAAGSGFPLDPTKWMPTYSNSANTTTTGPGAPWAQIAAGMQLSLPIGAWKLEHFGTFEAIKNTSTDFGGDFALSTSTSSVSDTDLAIHIEVLGASGTVGSLLTTSASKFVNVATATTYYAIQTGTATAIGTRGDKTPYIIRAIPAYL